MSAGEDTDISAYDNVIFIENTEVGTGQAELSVKMNNTLKVQGVQFDLYLPDGMSFVTDDDGNAVATLSTERTTANKMTLAAPTIQKDGALRIVMVSFGGYAFDGTEGEILRVKVNVPDNMAEGDYPLIMKTETMASTSNETADVAYVKSALTVSSYTPGDVNLDGIINVSDATCIINHIIGKTPEVFNQQAADVNADGIINVADASMVINYILGKTTLEKANTATVAAKAKAAPRFAGSTTYIKTSDVSKYDDCIYIKSMEAESGSRCLLSVQMNNKHESNSLQLDIELPEGMSFELGEDSASTGYLSQERIKAEGYHAVNSRLQKDGKMRAMINIVNIGENSIFKGTSGEVLLIPILIGKDVAVGDYPIKVSNVAISSPTGEKAYCVYDTIVSTLTITGAAFDGMVLDENSTTPPAASDGAVNVKVRRTIKAGEWSTLVLPFAMTSGQAEAALGDDAKVRDLSAVAFEYENDDDEYASAINITLGNVDTSNGLKANHPYVIMTGKDITEFVVEGVEVDPEDEPEVKIGNRKNGYNYLKGTYVAETTVPEEGLFISGNELWYSVGATKMKGYRAYFELSNVLSSYYDESAAAKIKFVDGGTTGIHDIAPAGQAARIYTLDGRQASASSTAQLPQGVYIVNGKKVVIKR